MFLATGRSVKLEKKGERSQSGESFWPLPQGTIENENDDEDEND